MIYDNRTKRNDWSGKGIPNRFSYGVFPNRQEIFLLKDVNLDTITDMQSRGTGLGHSMDPGASVQKQNFTRNSMKLAQVLGAELEA